MSGYGLFQTSTLGMMSQSHRLNTIGYNIANVNTGGFKRTDTQFETVLSDNIFQQKDIGGVKPYARATNDIQGLITTSSRNLDLAISGKGFFSLQSDLDSSDQIFYTRDGSFEVSLVDGATSSVTADDGSTITVSNGYLVDKNGYFVRGVPINADGTFSAGSAGPMRVDPYAFVGVGQPTTLASLDLNLPQGYAQDAQTLQYGLEVFDSAAASHSLQFNFNPITSDNGWRMGVSADNLTSATFSPAASFSLTATGANRAVRFIASETINGLSTSTISVVDPTVNITSVADGGPLPLVDGIGVPGSFGDLAPGDQITIANGGANDGTYTVKAVLDGGARISIEEAVTNEVNTTGTTMASVGTYGQPLQFDGNGQLTSVGEYTITLAWDDGETNTITLDLAEMNQYAGDFIPYRSSQNGYPSADLNEIAFDSAGQVVGTFSDGTQRAIYKIPLYDFANPNGLDSDNGMIFKETSESGSATEFFADESSKASFVPNATEVSNVDIAQEFSLMIQTQNAYNMCATTFKTIDEMTTVARDLKA